MATIVKYDVSENEFWHALNFLQQGADEYGLIVAGVGLEHFMDLYLDAKDAEAGKTGGTPAQSKARSMSKARHWSKVPSISPTIPMIPIHSI